MKFASLSARTSAALLICACAAAPMTAWATPAELTTTVRPLSAAVTYSTLATASPARPQLDTYVGYTVSVANASKSTITHVNFTGSTLVTDGDEKAVFSSSDGATCTADADGTTISCPLGKLDAGDSFPTFTVFFKAPVKDTLSPLPDGVSGSCATTDCVEFSGVSHHSEAKHQHKARWLDHSGKGHGKRGHKPPVDNSAGEWQAAEVTLGTPSAVQVKSALPKEGGSLFTGAGGVSSGTDPFTTTVVVPPSPSYTTVEIVETPDNINCTNNFNACFRADITIPGTFSPYLTIVLRQDASTIVKGTKIESVLIEYTSASGTTFIGDCASPTTPRNDGIPCLASRRTIAVAAEVEPVVPKTGKLLTTTSISTPTPTPTPVVVESFEWTLINLGNGSYKVL
jgi:hypothetical protein